MTINLQMNPTSQHAVFISTSVAGLELRSEALGEVFVQQDLNASESPKGVRWPRPSGKQETAAFFAFVLDSSRRRVSRGIRQVSGLVL